MWNKGAIPGGAQPYIKGTSIKNKFAWQRYNNSHVCIVSIGPQSHGTVSLLIYEWNDFENLGMYDERVGDVGFYEQQKRVEG
jgi:hypothetical protein